MTAARRYLLGVAGVAVAAAAFTLSFPRESRAPAAWGAVTGLVLQAPLGWWAIESLGTERFVVIWGVGMLLRLASVGIAGLVVVPLLGWAPGPALGSLVAVLVALLLVEGAAAWREHSDG